MRQCVSIEENIESILLRQLTNECVHCDLGSTWHEGITMNQECVNLMLSVPLWEVKTKADYIIHLRILYTHIIPNCRSGGQKKLTADKLLLPKKSFTVHKCMHYHALGEPL